MNNQQEMIAQAQADYAYKKAMEAEMKKNYLSFDNELREWYEWAKKSLRFTNSTAMEIPQTEFRQLGNQIVSINLLYVAILCNNVQATSQNQFNLTFDEYCDVLDLNQRIGDRWHLAIEFIKKTVDKRLQIMGNKPLMNIKRGQA